ncbi:MAG: LPS export ABC transporter periplasmic protein LptC [Bacteroidota bacterium]
MFFTARHTGFITALLAGCFILAACENDIKDIPNRHDKRTAMDEGRHIESYLSQNGKVEGKLTAPLMYIYQGDSSYTEFPNTLHVDFYNDSMVKESQMDARYGKYRQWENKIFLKDCVVVINVLKGDTLRCQELWWDQNAKKFYTNKPARYSQKDHFVNYGKNGLEAKQDLSDLVFYDNSGTLPVPKDDTLSAPVNSPRTRRDTLTHTGKQ